MEDSQPVLIYDYREDPSGIPAMIEKAGLVILRREALPCADYIAGNTGIERKTFSDLRASLADGRLFDQLSWLRTMFPRRLLILEGVAGEENSPEIRKGIRDLLVSVVVKLQIPLLRTKNKNPTRPVFWLIWHAGNREQHLRTQNPGRPKSRSPLL